MYVLWKCFLPFCMMLFTLIARVNFYIKDFYLWRVKDVAQHKSIYWICVSCPSTAKQKYFQFLGKFSRFISVLLVSCHIFYINFTFSIWFWSTVGQCSGFISGSMLRTEEPYFFGKKHGWCKGLNPLQLHAGQMPYLLNDALKKKSLVYLVFLFSFPFASVGVSWVANTPDSSVCTVRCTCIYAYW